MYFIFFLDRKRKQQEKNSEKANKAYAQFPNPMDANALQKFIFEELAKGEEYIMAGKCFLKSFLKLKIIIFKEKLKLE